MELFSHSATLQLLMSGRPRKKATSGGLSTPVLLPTTSVTRLYVTPAGRLGSRTSHLKRARSPSPPPDVSLHNPETSTQQLNSLDFDGGAAPSFVHHIKPKPKAPVKTIGVRALRRRGHPLIPYVVSHARLDALPIRIPRLRHEAQGYPDRRDRTMQVLHARLTTPGYLRVRQLLRRAHDVSGVPHEHPRPTPSPHRQGA